jgi:hypothetical protein
MPMASRARNAISDVARETEISNLVTFEDASKDTLAYPRLMKCLQRFFAWLALMVTASSIGEILPLSVC